jgi:type III secretion system low calcium response chaperone LcrH/SycD
MIDETNNESAEAGQQAPGPSLVDIMRNPTVEGLAQVLSRFDKGETMADMTGYPRANLEAMYTNAYNLYTQGKYAEAMATFGLLMTYNHLDRRYFNGFAACLQMQKRYQEAIKYYGLARMFEPRDLMPVLHIAECQLALLQLPQAQATLLYLREQIKDEKQLSALNARVDGVLALIEKNPATKKDNRGSQHAGN